MPSDNDVTASASSAETAPISTAFQAGFEAGLVDDPGSASQKLYIKRVQIARCLGQQLYHAHGRKVSVAFHSALPCNIQQRPPSILVRNSRGGKATYPNSASFLSIITFLKSCPFRPQVLFFWLSECLSVQLMHGLLYDGCSLLGGLK